MTTYRWMIVLVLSLFISCCTKGGSYSLSLRYQPSRDFPSLQKKIGPSLGIAPVKDERPETLYIGIHNPLQGLPQRFESEPAPLEKAIADSVSRAFAGYGIKTIPVSSWDRKPESLKNMETDSVLSVEIKRFWAEGKAAPFQSNLKTSICFVFHLGIKREGRVITRNVEVEREITLFSVTPERVGTMVNQILTDIFDNFLSNPY
jgi:hypothetical protein